MLWVVLILFLAAFTRSSIGFGDSILAMALLPFVIHIKTATPIVSLAATLIGCQILWSQWRNVDVTSVWRLILASIAGIPLGIWGLKSLPEQAVKVVLGILLIVYALYNLFRPALLHLKSDNWAFLAGFVAGVLGAAYNTNGPPIVVYASLRKWSPERFVATIQGYFLPTGVFIVIGHGIAGLWNQQVLTLYIVSVPAIVLAVWLGEKIRSRIRPETFQKVLNVVLVVAGSLMIAR